MIPIIGNWVLVVDNTSYTIAQYFGERPRKGGGTDHVLRNQKYYTSLGAAFRGLRGQLERETLSKGFPRLTDAFRAVILSNERLENEFRRLADLLEGEK